MWFNTLQVDLFLADLDLYRVIVYTEWLITVLDSLDERLIE